MDLSELRERVEKACGPSFDLDREIGLLLGGWSRVHFAGEWMLQDAEGSVFPDASGAIYDDIYTASVDLALALVERELPGWRVGFNSDPDRGPVWWASLKRQGDDWKNAPSGYAKTAPLAILLALIVALLALSEEDGRPQTALVDGLGEGG